MRIDLIELHRKLGTTFVYVTHDQVEAMSMADTIVLMNKGMIQQEAAPELIYRDPANQFVAQFIGVPPMNISELPHNEGIKFGFRPEKAKLTFEPQTSDFSVKGEIVTREMLGSETLYQVRYKNHSYMVKCTDDPFRTNETVFLHVDKKDVFIFDQDGNRVAESNPSFQNFLESLKGY